MHFRNTIIGDGNCFYCSVIDQLRRKEILQENLQWLQELNRLAQQMYHKPNNAEALKNFSISEDTAFGQEFTKRQHARVNTTLPYLTAFALRNFVCDIAESQYCGPNISPRNREVAEVVMVQENYDRQIPLDINQFVSMHRRPGDWANQFFINITSYLLKIPIQITTDAANSTEANLFPFESNVEKFPGKTFMILGYHFVDNEGNHYQSLWPDQDGLNTTVGALAYQSGSAIPGLVIAVSVDGKPKFPRLLT